MEQEQAPKIYNNEKDEPRKYPKIFEKIYKEIDRIIHRFEDTGEGEIFSAPDNDDTLFNFVVEKSDKFIEFQEDVQGLKIQKILLGDRQDCEMWLVKHPSKKHIFIVYKKHEDPVIAEAKITQEDLERARPWHSGL